jgi:flagellar protein FlbD
MIEVTRLNGSSMMLNSDLIKTAEASPDTMITLVNGEKLIVREAPAEIVERMLAHRARLLAAVARRLPGYSELPRIVTLSGIELGLDAGPEQSGAVEPIARSEP